MDANRQWRVAIIVPERMAEAFTTALAEGAAAVSSFELDDGPDWLIEATWPHEPDRARLVARAAVLAAAGGLEEPVLTIEPLPAIDWVSRCFATFPPLRAGRYDIRGTHVAEPAPPGAVALRVDAATAFGTGEHGSTRGCLLALDRLARRWQGWQRRRLGTVLDLGCGSGILALAAARTWHVPVLAIDLDAESVRVATANARLNQVSALVRCRLGHGVRAGGALGHRRCRLILANILARPLARLAPGIARHLAPGGVVVLAGLLPRQEALVLAAYRTQHLVLRERLTIQGWRTLVVGRQGGNAERRSRPATA